LGWNRRRKFWGGHSYRHSSAKERAGKRKKQRKDLNGKTHHDRLKRRRLLGKGLDEMCMIRKNEATLEKKGSIVMPGRKTYTPCAWIPVLPAFRGKNVRKGGGFGSFTFSARTSGGETMGSCRKACEKPAVEAMTWFVGPLMDELGAIPQENGKIRESSNQKKGAWGGSQRRHESWISISGRGSNTAKIQKEETITG